VLTLPLNEGSGSRSAEESAGGDFFGGLGCLGEDVVHVGGGDVGGEGGAAGVGG